MVEVTANSGEKGEESAAAGCVGILHPGGENVGENGNSSVGRKRSAMGKERRMEDKSRPTLAGKENIRSPFIFINKTSRRVRSSGK